MLSPILVASTDAARQLLVLTVEGPLVDPNHVDALRLVLPSVPTGHSLIVDLSGVAAFSDDSLAELRSVALDAIELGQTMILVCSDVDRRADLVLADLDTLVPVVEAVEQALPIARAAA